MKPSRPAGLCAPALLLLLLLGAAAAESVRETETMDPQLYEFPSGDLPDDEDSRPDFVIDEDGYDYSGSGDEEDDTEDALLPASERPMEPMDNFIPYSKGETKDSEPAVIEIENDSVLRKPAPSEEGDEPSNKISMASTANGSIFERTEVLAALIAGGAVGLLLFAVFPILLLIYRMKKKDEGSYDLGKKPIYKKAPTNEFYA
ncbi:syndecan-4 [Podarcis muralis]|nr:syndecan-4 [Podarcis muralis]